MTPQKRALDIALALLFGFVLMPVIAGLALAVRLSSGAPVLYLAERMKSPTQAFHLAKFRTMRPAAGDAGVTGGDKSDRITPLGRFLRRTRMDELPQLWNVLRGDISFVGPRPPLRAYVDAYPGLYADVLRSRPGITGLASLRFHQHEERLLAACADAAETDAVYRRRCVPRKARLDLIYAANANICYDLQLISETARRAFSGR